MLPYIAYMDPMGYGSLSLYIYIYITACQGLPPLAALGVRQENGTLAHLPFPS